MPSMLSEILAAIAREGASFATTSSDASRQKLIASADALIRELESPGEQVARIGWGEPSRTAALRTAFELGLLQNLADKALGSRELAEGTKADPNLVARTLKHLTAYGIVKEVGKDSYVGSPFSMATNDPTLAGTLIYSFEGMIPTFIGLPEFLSKTGYQSPTNGDNGPVQYGLRTHQHFFALLQSDARLGSAFNQFMTGYAKVRPRWTEIYPVEERLGGVVEDEITLIDVGGGLGHETMSLATAFPHLSGRLVVQDLPSVIAEAKTSLPSNIEAVAHDFFTPQPAVYAGAKAYFMRLVLHDWPDDKSIVILGHLRDAMRRGHSRVLINETVMLDVGAPWQQTSLDWTMMGMLLSKERTESQWTDLLKEAGLKISGVWTNGNESVIEAALADE